MWFGSFGHVSANPEAVANSRNAIPAANRTFIPSLRATHGPPLMRFLARAHQPIVAAEFFFRPLMGPRRTVENGTNFLFENILRQRLLHQLDTRIETPFMNDGVPRIAGHKQHLDPRLAHLQCLCELSTIHPRQHYIGQQQIHLDVITIDYRHGRLRVVRLQNAVVQLAQDFNHVGANVVIILDEEDRLGAIWGDFLFWYLILPDFSEQARQIDFDDRAFAGFAVDLDVAVRLLDEAIDLAQAEASSLTVHLGREERFKHTFQNILRHSRAGVAHRNPHVLSGDKFVMMTAVVLVEEGVAGRNRQLAAFRHGISSVYREIEDSGLQLDWIGFHLPQAVGSENIESDGLAQRAAQEIKEAVEELVYIEGLRIERLLSRKR